MPIERVRVLKVESAATGGDGGDEVEYPSPIDLSEDYVDARGVALQNNTSNDEVVTITRDASNNLIFTDGTYANKTLTDLVTATGMTATDHKVVRQLIHFIDEGPGDGFYASPYKEVLPSADPFPTQTIWWNSSAKTLKILEKNITRNSNKTPNTIAWILYDGVGNAPGNKVITMTDTIAYSGVFETTRTRTYV